jgi:hypothetical protein
MREREGGGEGLREREREGVLIKTFKKIILSKL